MKRITEPIPEGLKVKLSTEQEWKDVLQILEDDGWRWYNIQKPTELLSKYSKGDRKGICTDESKEIGLWDGTGDYISAQSFINTYSEKLLYKVGDVVVVEKIGEDWDNKSSIGKTTKITKIGSCGSILLDNNKYRINYRPEWLRPATEEEIKVYQQSQKPVDNRTKLSFRTEDGYDLYEGDEVHWIMNTKVPPKPWVYQQVNGVGEWSLQYIEKDNRVFHSKENAERYIEEQNRPKEPVYKVGDWVVSLHERFSQRKVGIAHKIYNISGGGVRMEPLDDGAGWLAYEDIRSATPEEIAKATGTSTVKESIPVIVVGDTVEVKGYGANIDGKIGTVITVDSTTMPYKVKIPNGGTFWLTKEQVKKVTTNQQSQTKTKDNDKDNQTNSNNQQSISKQQNNEEVITYFRTNSTVIEGPRISTGEAVTAMYKIKPQVIEK